jgi:hypothetical protein
MRAIAVLCALPLAVASCGNGSRVPGGTGDGGADAPGPASSLASLVVSTGDLRPAFDPSWTEYDVTSLNSLYPISVTATVAEPGATLTIHGTPAESGAPATFTLTPKEDFTVVVQAPGASSQTYTVHYVPSDLPPYVVTSSTGAGTEDVLLEPASQYLLMIDRSGAPLYYRSFLPSFADDFQKWTLPSGKVVYSATVGHLNTQGWTLGVDHLMDDHFNDIGDLQLLAYAQHGVLPAEAHDLRLIDEQHYIAMSYVQRTIDLSALDPAWSSQAIVMSGVLQEVDNGQVLLEWDSANVPSLYADSIAENSFDGSSVSDYLHMNSIDIDPADENLIVSFRHTSSIVKLDRHSGQILWTLGGKEDMFGLTGDQVFSFQHDVRMHPDRSMTVFDNGYPTARQTRVLSFVLDQTSHKVTSFQVLTTKPDTQPQTGFMGSATLLDGGRVFCGWGGWYTSGLGLAAAEIAGGQPVWTLEFTGPGVFSYRALPIAAP